MIPIVYRYIDLPIVPEVDKPFMSGEGERRNGPESVVRRKNLPTQGRGNSIGIPKSLQVYHFRCFPCLFHSPLEFVNPTPPPIKLKIACVLKRPCPWMNLHGFLKNARKLLQVACVCLSERTSKQSGRLPFEGVGGMGDFKLNIYISCKLISRGKNSCKEIPGQKNSEKQNNLWVQARGDFSLV